jgi:hypothetical protein
LYNKGSGKLKLKIMSIIIRKVTKKTILSFISMGGLILALAGRFVPWGSETNLSRLEAKAKNITLNSSLGLIDIANADYPSTDSSIDTDSIDTGASGGTGTDTGTDSEGGPTCFRAGQKVSMADGSLKNIEDVKIGEKVKGEVGATNTVLGYERPVIGSRKTYIINSKVEFTGDHPFLSKEGWKVADMNLFKAFPRTLPKEPTKLNIGDVLITESGEIVLETLEEKTDRPAEEMVYDLKLDGNNTYTVEGFIVHNC